jgi:hypothetical protein
MGSNVNQKHCCTVESSSFDLDLAVRATDLEWLLEWVTSKHGVTLNVWSLIVQGIPLIRVA